MEAGFDDVLALHASDALRGSEALRRAEALCTAEDLLDIGCGDGTYLAGLRAAGHYGRLVGIDIEPELVTAARDNASAVSAAGAARDTASRDAQYPGSTVEFMTGDAAQLPYPAASFDAVTARYVIDHLPDPAAAIAEARRVTRPGGRLVRIANAEGHLSEFWALVPALAPPAGAPLETRFVELAAQHFDAVTVTYLSRVIVLPDVAVAVSLLDTHRVALRTIDEADWVAARSDLIRRGSRPHDAFPLHVTLRLCVVRADVHAPDHST